MPEISVIMAVYNGEMYLPKAIESVLQQSFVDFEFLIYDDGSTDNTAEILRRYAHADRRIKVFTKALNTGPAGFSQNLNKGLSTAVGRYIARMDADDVCVTNRFSKQKKILDENSEIFMVGSSVTTINESDEVTGSIKALQYHSDIEKALKTKVAMYHPTIMFRNTGVVWYREKMFFCEDYDLYLRLLSEKQKFYNITEPLLEYRILNTSVSRKGAIFEKRLFFEKAKSFYKERQKNGIDHYDSFDHESLQLPFSVSADASHIEFLLHTALQYEYYDIFKKIVKEYVVKSKYKIIAHLPNTMFKLYAYAYRKLLW